MEKYLISFVEEKLENDMPHICNILQLWARNVRICVKYLEYSFSEKHSH